MTIWPSWKWICSRYPGTRATSLTVLTDAALPVTMRVSLNVWTFGSTTGIVGAAGGDGVACAAGVGPACGAAGAVAAGAVAGGVCAGGLGFDVLP